ncbi:MAG: hypothetical protein R2771_13925 [Saprospiraceae bacterium]
MALLSFIPDIIYVILESAEKGFKTGFFIALGLVSGLWFTQQL